MRYRHSKRYRSGLLYKSIAAAKQINKKKDLPEQVPILLLVFWLYVYFLL